MSGLRTICTLTLLVSACAGSPVGEAEAPFLHQSFRVPLPVCDRARVEFGMVDGKLIVEPGATAALLQGECRFRGEDGRPRLVVQRLDPEIHIDLAGGRRDRCDGPSLSSSCNEWSIGLSEAVPLDLDVRLGSAQGSLDLSGLHLQSVDLRLDDSEVAVDFERPNPGVLHRMRLVTQAGAVSLRGLGNAGFEHLVVDGGSGRIDLEFHGEWTHSARADVSAGLSAVRIRLPRDLAVTVVSEADLSAAGFRRVDGRWCNDAWSEASTIQLALQVDAGIGSIDLQQY